MADIRYQVYTTCDRTLTAHLSLIRSPCLAFFNGQLLRRLRLSSRDRLSRSNAFPFPFSARARKQVKRQESVT